MVLKSNISLFSSGVSCCREAGTLHKEWLLLRPTIFVWIVFFYAINILVKYKGKELDFVLCG
jgi:hypothetical protein